MTYWTHDGVLSVLAAGGVTTVRVADAGTVLVLPAASGTLTWPVD